MKPLATRRTNACSTHSRIPILHPIRHHVLPKDPVTMIMRKLIITRTSGNVDKFSVKTKDPVDCMKLEPLVRKIFHNELITGATINYSNGHVIRIDLDTDM